MSEELDKYVQSLKVTELRDELKKRNLSINGLKAQLIQRLKDAIASEKEGNEQEEDIPAVQDNEEPTNEVSENNEEGTVANETNNEGTTESNGEEANQTELAAVSKEEEHPSSEVNDESVSVPNEPSTIEATGQQQADVQTNEDIPTNGTVTSADSNDNTVNVPPNDTNTEVTDTDLSIDQPVNDEEQGIIVVDEIKQTEPNDEQQTVSETCQEETEELHKDDSDVTQENEGQNEPPPVAEDVSRKEHEQMETEANEQKPTEEEAMEYTSDQPQTRASDQPQTRENDQPQTRENVESIEHSSRYHDSDSRKRNRDDEDDKKSKVDPQAVPDPETVKDWTDESIQAICNESFIVTEEIQGITLNPYKSDLHFIIESSGTSGYSLTEGGFAYMKASAKATCGIRNGCYFYECKIEENLPVDVECPHLVRLGWSTLDSEMIVGDDRFSYCYESTGKAVTRTNPEDYSEEFGQGDVIGCYINFTSESKVIFFTKNGVRLSDAFDLTDQDFEQTLFPHVSVRNVRVSFNFGENPPTFPVEEGFLAIQEATEEDEEMISISPPVSKSDCEIIVMIGLPCCGKTNWCSKYSARNIDKSYRIIGPYQILDQVWSEKRKTINNWNSFVELTSPIVNTLLVLASKLPCNYILDQINVYADTRQKKMNYFEGFVRKAMVVIPPHHELRKRRSDRLRDGDCVDVPQDVMDAFKANFYIPKPEDGIFDEINFSEIYGPASEKIVRQYKDDALGLPTPYIPSKRSRYEQRGRNYGGSRPKGGPYGYGPYGSARHYHPPPRGYYPPPPPPSHYRSNYYPPYPSAGGWGNPSHRGRYGHPPPNPRYNTPHHHPYYPPRGGSSSGGYYNRYNY